MTGLDSRLGVLLLIPYGCRLYTSLLRLFEYLNHGVHGDGDEGRGGLVGWRGSLVGNDGLLVVVVLRRLKCRRRGLEGVHGCHLCGECRLRKGLDGGYYGPLGLEGGFWRSQLLMGGIGMVRLRRGRSGVVAVGGFGSIKVIDRGRFRLRLVGGTLEVLDRL